MLISLYLSKILLMRTIGSFALLAIMAFFLTTGCKKSTDLRVNTNDSTQNPNNTDTTGHNNTDTTHHTASQDTATIESFFHTYYDGYTSTIVCRNPNLSIRWQKSIGGFVKCNYNKGNVYYVGSTSIGTSHLDTLYSVKIANGAVNWTCSMTGKDVMGVIFYNDSVYLNLHSTTGNYLEAHSLANGNVSSQTQLNSYQYGTSFTANSANIFVGIQVDNGTHYYLMAYDVIARQFLWSIPTVGNGTAGVGWPQIVNDRLYARSPGGMTCFNKSNGTVIWNYPINSLNNPIIMDNRIFASDVTNYKLYAMDAVNGSALWNKPGGFVASFARGYGSDNKYFSFEVETNDSLALVSFDAATGNQLKHVSYTDRYRYMVICENKIFAQTHPSYNPDPEKFMIFDCNTLQKVDSIITDAVPAYSINSYGPVIITRGGEIRQPQ